MILFDNFKIDVVGEEYETLIRACSILGDTTSCGYKIWAPNEKTWDLTKTSPLPVLSFLSWIDPDSKEKKAFPFISPIKHGDIAKLAWEWVVKQKYTLPIPDFDGDTHSGWRLFTGEYPNSLINISPDICLYGK